MIVQCDKCWTKFRIADQKVTETGVKVRCSRCAHVFMVKRGPTDRGVEELEQALRDAGLELMPPVAHSVGGGGPAPMPSTFGAAGSEARLAAGFPGQLPGGLGSGLPSALPPSPPGQRHSVVGHIEPNLPSGKPPGVQSGFALPPSMNDPGNAAFGLVSGPSDAAAALGFGAPPQPSQQEDTVVPGERKPGLGTRPPNGFPGVSMSDVLPPPSYSPGFERPSTGAGKAFPPAGGFELPNTGSHGGARPFPPPVGFELPNTGSDGGARPFPPPAGFELPNTGSHGGARPFPPPAGFELPNTGSHGGARSFPPPGGFELPNTGSQGGAAAFPPPSFELPNTGAASRFPPPPSFEAQRAANASSWSPSHARIEDGGRFPPLESPGISQPPDILGNGGNHEAFGKRGTSGEAARPRTSAGVVDRFPASLDPRPDPASAAAMFPAPAFPFGGSGTGQQPSGGVPGFESNQALGDRSAVPSIIPNGAGDDPFAGLDLGAGNEHESLEGWTDETRPVGQGLEISGSSPLATIEPAPGGGASFERGMAATRVASDLLPRPVVDTARPKTISFDPPTPRWPTFAGLMLGGIITLLAVLGPAGGDVSRFDPEDLVALVQNPFAGSERALADVEVRNAQVTLYPGKSGRKLLVIAGEAYNAGSQPITGVEAVATVRDPADALEQRDTRLGVTLAEDTLSEIDSPAALEMAINRARSDAPDRVTLAPGAVLPFMVVFVFQNPPDDLEKRSFHIELRQGAVAEGP